MRKLFLFVVGMLFMFTACQKDELSGPEMSTSQTITVNIPQGVLTKATTTNFGDGSKVNRCILQVYRNGSAYGKQQVAEVKNNAATFQLRLVVSQTYDFVFWADCATGTTVEDFADNHYVTTDLTTVKVNGEYAGNDDDFDAFTGKLLNYKVTGAFAESVTLKRPFGQLNVKTLDLNTIPSDELKPTKVKVSFTGIPTTFNAKTGVVGTETAPVAYEADVLNKNTGELTVDYIWAPEEESVLSDFTMTFLNGDTEISQNDAFTSIPIRRNYRTNVSGNLLTKQGSFTVTVAPEFDGEYNKGIMTVDGVENVTEALASGATSVIVKDAPTTATTIEIPKMYADDNATEISITLPATSEAITIQYDARSEAAPAVVNLTMPTSDNLVIDLPNSTVTLNGTIYQNVTATTAANTLIIPEGVEVKKLTVKGGNVEIYGKVITITWEQPESVVKVYSVGDAAAFDRAVQLTQSGKCEKIVLAKDLTVAKAATELVGILDLNGKVLTFSNTTNTSLLVPENKSLTIQNGTIKAFQKVVTHAFALVDKNATFLMDKVVLETTASGLSPANGADGATLKVMNSTINARIYGITTNASKPFNCDIVLENSTFTGSDPVLINVPCSLVMKKCKAIGTMHGVVVRGGTAVIEDSEITFEYNDEDYEDMTKYFESKDWGQGNTLNLAAMTIGNKAPNAYQYPTNVTLLNTKLILGGKYGSHFPALYAHANQGEGLGVTLTYDSSCQFAKEPEKGSENIVVNVK